MAALLSTRLPLFGTALLVWVLWLAGMVTGDRWHLFADNWFMSATMAGGSFIAGATSEGGGSAEQPGGRGVSGSPGAQMRKSQISGTLHAMLSSQSSASPRSMSWPHAKAEMMMTIGRLPNQRLKLPALPHLGRIPSGRGPTLSNPT